MTKAHLFSRRTRAENITRYTLSLLTEAQEGQTRSMQGF